MTCCALPKNVPEGIHEILKTAAHRSKLQSINKMQGKRFIQSKEESTNRLDFYNSFYFESQTV
jgi:hypothetical protein